MKRLLLLLLSLTLLFSSAFAEATLDEASFVPTDFPYSRGLLLGDRQHMAAGGSCR